MKPVAGLQVERLTVGILSVNCYILHVEGRTDCVVIDPGGSPDRIREKLGGRNIAAILLTHGHFDHIGAVDALMAPDTALVVHALDDAMLQSPHLNVSWMVSDDITCRRATRTVAEGDLLLYAGIPFRVLHTPGHTPGSVCYECGDLLFTGDTVMGEGYGRCDLPGGDEQAMMSSLRRLQPLRETHQMLGGHG